MNTVGAVGARGKDNIVPGIIASKLLPPADNPTQLARSQLVDSIARAHTARLVLIRAAAGFGKTTVMAQYAAHCRTQRRDAVWLRLDSTDNDLRRFLLHLDAGLQTLPGARLDGLAAVHSGSEERISTALIERVAAHGRPLSILLDDFETIQSPPVLTFTQRLIDALAPGSHLIVASRVTPELGLGRIRARGELLDITPGALRFSLAETTRFIRDRCGIALRDREIATLHRCTEGWVTAIYLATLSLRTRTDHVAFVASFSGTNIELAEFLAEDILARQSEACRTFLLETSALSQFSAELCNDVIGRTDSREMLDYLERSNLFIVPLDGERSWYRYHRLFASFLRHRLHADQPQREAQIHVAAANWFIRAERPIPGIEHLLDAGEHEVALVQIARNSRRLLGGGRIRLLMRWLDRIRPELLTSAPRVRLTYAWVLLFNRRYSDAMHTAQQIVSGHARDDTTDPLALEAEALRGVLFALTDQIEACRDTGLATLERLPDDANFPYFSLTNSLAFSLVSTYRYDEARSVLSRALQRRQDHPFVVMRSMAEAIEGVIDLVQGRLGTALARMATASIHDWRDQHDEAAVGRTSIYGPRSLALYEADDLDEVSRLLGEALPLAKSVSPPDSLITAHVLLARIALIRGDKEQWLRLLAELEQIGRLMKSERAVCSAWIERARIATLEGRLDAAEQALRAAYLHASWETPEVSFHANDIDLPSLTRLRLDIASGRFSTAEAGLADALDQANGTQRYWRALKIRLLRSLALDGLGRRDAAFADITEALRVASHEGFVRTFVDEGQPMMALIRDWAQEHRQDMASLGVVAAFVERLLTYADGTRENLETAGHGAQRKAGSPHEELTSRELDVLRMLSAGHRNKGIAERLFVSELTIKSHLRKINAKLGAQNRTQAVAIGRDKGLIP
ncbi:HTH-type transcriptional regulator MalT [Paraburkholderia hiiakae]|uniref:HTH-type transcriptional regulator MalT n=1 Tax=Paraburkholderia hiiakae TaxID=1081782 RepID=A0ABN7IHV9_9BURK|nr:LuxR C-terminal-related transcriptional regulator [Paraburkholderia hiiakae]CAD6561605.1 HTH-type transcriptional regulator MalT [Paraburkholderia hiiakae]